MGDWYNAKIKYTQVTEDDKVKTISESYLFDALSYTEAEARTYDYMASNLPDFELVDIKKMRLTEVFFIEDGGDYWFKCRVQYITFDEKTKSEKKTAVPMLINATDLKAAFESLVSRLGNLEDYIISDINVTKIVEVVPYEKLVDQKISDGRLKPMADVIPATRVEPIDEVDLDRAAVIPKTKEEHSDELLQDVPLTEIEEESDEDEEKGITGDEA